MDFPNDLIQKYSANSSKLKKFQRVMFKRFGPNVSEISENFNLLALNFEHAVLYQFAGLCYLLNAKCEKALGNTFNEIDILLKSGRAFLKADEDIEKLGVSSNNHENLEGALRCYNQALSRIEDDSVMKAAIIREIKKINPIAENTSNFFSPSHRIYDLEESANNSIKIRSFYSALEKLTEIFDDITERNKENIWLEVLQRNEISRLLILLILELPPSRQSPSNIKLLEKYSLIEESEELRNQRNEKNNKDEFMQEDLKFHFQDLVLMCQIQDSANISIICNKIIQFECITQEQQELIKYLVKRFN